MNIIEAVREATERHARLRRTSTYTDSGRWFEVKNLCFQKLVANDILADDWEVEDQAVELTEAELASLLKSYVGDTRFNGMLYSEALNAIVADIFERKIKGSITE